MKNLLIVGFLGWSGLFAGCSGMANVEGTANAKAKSCPYCTEKVTQVRNSKGFLYRTRIDYLCSVCGTNCNQDCPKKCAECATSLACCNR